LTEVLKAEQLGDTTAGDMLVDLDLELNAAEIHLVFAGLKNSIREKIKRYVLLKTMFSILSTRSGDGL
jgi:hypothetical protein